MCERTTGHQMDSTGLGSRRAIHYKCFANAGVLNKGRNVVEAVEPRNDEDPFSDLEDNVSQVEMLLNESCCDTAVTTHEAIAHESVQ